MTNAPRVTLIIPHYLGDILLACLERVHANSPLDEMEIIVVDDGPTPDKVLDQVRLTYPEIRLFRTAGRRGFGASCNLGLRNARGKYAVLLNNDAVVAPGWLPPLIQEMERDPRLGICQPKILSLANPGQFDPGGGTGGYLDLYGYPFALGSLVHTIENDHGQYDQPRDLLWAHGSATLLRRSLLDKIGFFDEAFYMQAEEIDLCCRALKAGFAVRSVPASVVYHHFGWTLKRNSFERFYLSHRNTLVVMLKHWPVWPLAWSFPVRLMLEVATVIYGLLVRRDWKQPLGVVTALGWLLFHFPSVARRRRCDRHADEQKIWWNQTVYKGSILWDYFVRKITTTDEILRRAFGDGDRSRATSPRA